jgi:hypothetical protein
MEKEKESETKATMEGIILGHELTDQGTKLVVLTNEMENVPRRIKFYW